MLSNYLNDRENSGHYGNDRPDVNDDLQVTPADALVIINYLNGRLQQGEGETATDQVFVDWSVVEAEYQRLRRRA